MSSRSILDLPDNILLKMAGFRCWFLFICKVSDNEIDLKDFLYFLLLT